ncbi:DUF308 domain-containing protein [Sphingomonas sp. S2-65]|uniref:DUF308 domain-containing protein n=1 Tax=Sphingomonas sp. S2-65 TaxID=2903960 RepID=UPI001F26AE4B|nr:DUF308 domain-containing protein [Sphingomonas sp. S2-65]UYY59921.1 DUF308 domain-containing protein [Sphingomonas sp. S2-65]
MMQRSTATGYAASEASNWLKRYYFLRFAVAAIWVAMAFTVAKESQLLAAVLLAAYPAWDAVANILDARRSGGLSRNKSQSLNVLVSLVTAAAVGVALGHSLNAVLAIYGVWAALAGLFQLATAIGRWRRFGAQWVMILSGAQSALAGIFFIKMSGGNAPVGIVNVAPYAAFGAFYFLVSAIWLVVADVRRGGDRAPA